MKWNSKNIAALEDDELWEAIHSVGTIDANRVDKLSQSRKRHVPIFNKHPPTENPAFTQLAVELNTEFKNRKL